MFVLVIGRNKSGKSKYAEKLAHDLAGGGPLYYLASMIPYGEGEDGGERVARHRKQREGYGFATIEEPFRLAGVSLPQDATALLEDVSNLLANNLFADGGSGGAGEVLEDVAAFSQRGRHLVAVSIGGLLPKDEYDGPTNRYIEGLNELNTRLAALADAVVEMRDGEPRLTKGSLG